MVNQMILQGRLVRDPELRRTDRGTAVCRFTVAWSEKRGETEKRLFLECVAWNGTAENVARYVAKGQQIVVTGRMQQREYQGKDGDTKKVLELQVGEIHFCGSKPGAGQRTDQQPGSGQPARQCARRPRSQQPVPEDPYAGFCDLDDSDFPF